MEKMPNHGRIGCNRCFPSNLLEFDKSQYAQDGWRITANPLAWGNQEPEIIVLGFSKGPTQAGALASSPHNEIAYKGSRGNVAKILAHIGVLSVDSGQDPAQVVHDAIANTSGQFHFGSLIRCTVERYDTNTATWKGSGGGMLDRFVSTQFGQHIAQNCTERFLSKLPNTTKLIVMFGLGTGLNYVKSAFKLYQSARGGRWQWLNDVAYTDDRVVVVHVEHFASQGPLISQWLGDKGHPRKVYGQQAQEAAASVIDVSQRTASNTPSIATAHATQNRPPMAPLTKEVRAQRKASASTEPDGRSFDSDALVSAIACSGYRLINENKKLAEFRGSNGQTVHLIKTNASINNIKLMVNPRLAVEQLHEIDGIDSVSSEHRFHSNMPQFPKKLNSGKTETTYGWQLSFTTFGGLESFLRQFREIQF